MELLHEDGAKDVIIAATHGVLSDPAAERLAACGAREVIVTNTLPIPDEKKFDKLTVLSVGPLIAEAISAVKISAGRFVAELITAVSTSPCAAPRATT